MEISRGDRQLDVVIVGGGIGGLALGHYLQQAGMSFAIIERNASDAAQGPGALALRSPGGLDTIRELGMEPELERHAITTDRLIALADSNGHVLNELPHRPGAAVRVPRWWLSQVLASGLEAHTSFYNACTRYGYDAEAGSAYVELADESRVHGRLVVGFDGSRSTIRGQMVGDPRRDSEIVAIHGSVQDSDFAEQASLGAGPQLAFGHGASLVTMRTGPHSAVLWAANVHADSGETFDGLEGIELKDRARQQLAAWGAPYQRLIEQTAGSDVRFLGRFYDRYPRSAEEYTALNLQRVIHATIGGDALQPMLPFQGQGANQALVHARVLARYLRKYPRAFTIAVRLYLESVVPQAGKMVMASRKAAEAIHDPEVTPENAPEIAGRVFSPPA